jgi:hypothetical protein
VRRRWPAGGRWRRLDAALLCVLGVLAFHPPGLTQAASGLFDIREFGATGDGHTLDTAAINQAIEACHRSGGGQVRLPPGRYLSGTVHLRSRVTLYFDAGALLVGCTNLSLYQAFAPPADAPEAKWSRWHRALILGDGVTDVNLLGPGIVDGNRVFDPQGEERQRGPHTLLLGNATNVQIRGVTIRDSANYAVMLEHCRHVEIRDVRITGGWDGIHFRGWPGRPCRDVQISGCQLFTGDDAIAGRYWDNVLITGCVLNSSCNAVRLIGPATRLTIHDCLIYGPGVYPHRTSGRFNALAGLNLQPGAWDATAGSLDEVVLSDLTMHNVATPFHFSLKPGNTAGRITVSRVSATGVYRAAASIESWAETPFTNVVFRNVDVEFAGGGTRAQARQPVRSPGVDARPLPVWGFYARQVAALSFDDVRLSCEQPDLRPALLCESVDQLNLRGWRFPRFPDSADPVVLSNVKEVAVAHSDLTLMTPEVRQLEATMEGKPGPLRAGQPLALRLQVQPPPQDGLGQFNLDLGSNRYVRWAWLRASDTPAIEWRDLVAPAVGSHPLRANNLARTIAVPE